MVKRRQSKTATAAEPPTIETPGDLWRMLVEGGGLEPDGYDAPLVGELAGRLGVRRVEQGELNRMGISSEALLVHILHLLAPYGSMMVDVLTFFAQVGARASAENLQIRFEFDDASKGLQFDVRNFRDWVVRLREAFSSVLVDRLNLQRALELRHAFIEPNVTYRVDRGTWSDLIPIEASVVRWLEHVAVGSPPPPPPDIGDTELRVLLARVWRSLLLASHGRIADFPEPVLSQDDVRVIVRGAYLMRRRHERTLRERLRRVYEGVESEHVEFSSAVEELFDVFNLPVWRRRPELYSVWVGSRLIGAFGERVEVHTHDRTLVFSSAGANLATVQVSARKRLQVWCELRTPAKVLIGKGRKASVKPDYVVLAETAGRATMTALVVECKQYAKQSRAGFAAAIVDYARAHPKADVALVSYGVTTDTVMKRVATLDQSLVGRTRTISKLCPGSMRAIDEFETLVRFLAPVVASVPVVPSQAFPPAAAIKGISTGELTLSWADDVDLDLHCWVIASGQASCHVSFLNREWADGPAWVRLSEDVLTGGSSEILAWEVVGEIRLEIAAHAYNVASICRAGSVRVEARACGEVHSMSPPSSEDGTWWRVLTIAPGCTSVLMPNTVTHQPPIAD